MLHSGERNVNDELRFKWGLKTGVGMNKGHQFYGSFSINGSEYFLHDCVYIFRKGDCETTIGKLVKMFETTTRERKVKLVLFYRPIAIRRFFRDVDVEPRWNEIFLASGEGVGVSNYYFLDEIIKKCNVLCTLKDRRNPQPSKAELRKADYIFHRAFDVKKCVILESFPDKIDQVEVKFFFNRGQDLKQNNSDLQKNLGVVAGNSSLLSKFGQKNTAGSSLKSVTSIQDINHRNKGQWTSSYNNPRSLYLVGTKMGAFQMDQDKPKVRASEYLSPATHSDIQPHKKMKIQSSFGQNSVPEKRFYSVKPSETSKRAAPQHIQDKARNTKAQSLEAPKKPVIDKTNWFKIPKLNWEQRLRRAQELGTLVLLENLDPTFSSSEVEDLVQKALKQKVDAKMLQCSTICNPYYGKAFVLFESEKAAEMALLELTKRCLMLSDGRPIVGTRGTVADPSKRVNFVGHLTVEKLSRQRQTTEMKNAVSTSHCSQPNTIEHDMAMEWRLLQEQSDLWWTKLHEKQKEEVFVLKRQLKLKHMTSGSLI